MYGAAMNYKKYVETILLAVSICLLGAFMTAHAENNERTISVTGTGTAYAVPDRANLSFNTITETQTASEAYRQNSDATAKIIKALKQAGVKENQIQTSRISLSRRYKQKSYNSGREQDGYTATSTVSVKMDDLETIAETIDAAITAGAEGFSGPHFTLDDPLPTREEARRLAVKAAKREAALYAEAAGVELGKVISIKDSASSGWHPSPVGNMVTRTAAIQVANPDAFSLGEISEHASVSIVWEIE